MPAACPPLALASLQRGIWLDPLPESPGFLALLLPMHRGKSHIEDVQAPQTRCLQAEGGAEGTGRSWMRSRRMPTAGGQLVFQPPCATQPGGGQNGSVPCHPSRMAGTPMEPWGLLEVPLQTSPWATAGLAYLQPSGCIQLPPLAPQPGVLPAQLHRHRDGDLRAHSVPIPSPVPSFGVPALSFSARLETSAPMMLAEQSVPPEAAFRPAPRGTRLSHKHRLRDPPSRQTQPQVKPGEKSLSSRATSPIKGAISAAQDVTTRVTGNSQRQAGSANCPRGAVQMYMQGKK